MKKIYLTILLIIILSCKTTSNQLTPPIDYSDVIDEAVKIQPEVKNSNLKSESKGVIVRTTTSLQECQEYSKQAYSKFLDSEIKLNKCDEDTVKYKNRIEALEQELWFYRMIKYGLITCLVIFILQKLGVFQFIFMLIKKSINPVA